MPESYKPISKEVTDLSLDLSAYPNIPESAYTVEPLTNLPVPPKREEFSMGEEFYASWAASNPFAAGIVEPLDTTVHPPVEGYDPFKDPAVASFAPKLFIESDSPQQTRQIIERVRFQRQMADQDQGFFSVGSAAGHLAGMISNPATVAAAFTPGGLLKVVAAEIAAEGVNESLRHYQQPERTPAQSAQAIAIAGGAAAVIGGALKGYQAINRYRNRPTPDAPTPEIDPELTPSGSLSSAVAFPTEAELFDPVMVQNPAMVRAMGGTVASPSVDVAVNSYSEWAKRTLRDLVNVPTQFASGGAFTPVESLAKKANGDTAMMYKGFKEEYRHYKKAGGELSEDDFLIRVSDAMNSLDASDIPEVAKTAARFRIFDSQYFKAAIEQRLYGKNPPVQNLSHLQRLYKQKIIIDNRAAFKKVILRGLLRRSEEVSVVKIEGDVFTVNPADIPTLQQTHGTNMSLLDTTPESIDGIADNIIDTILGNRPEVKPNYAEFADPDHIVPLAGSIHARTLDFLTYDEIKPFIETNALSVMNVTAHQMTISIEMAKKFGDINLENRMNKIAKEYLEVKALAKPSEQKNIAKQEKRDYEVLTALRDQQYGVYKRPDMTSNFVQAGRALKLYTHTTYGQNIVTSSIPDIVGPALRHGFKPFYQGIKLIAQGNTKAYREFVNRMGIGVNTVTNARANALSGAGYQSAWEKAGTRAIFNWSGLNYFSDWTQSMNAMSVSEMWLNQIRKGPTAGEAQKMLDRGIDPLMAARIKLQVDKYGKPMNGTTLPETHNWKDKNAAAVYESALRTEIESTTLLPGLGDAPLWTKTEVGSYFAMYTSFVTSAHNKFLISGLQRRDADFLMGVLAITTAGMLTVAIKDTVRGQDITEKDMDRWLFDSLDRAGITGWLFSPLKFGYSASTGELPSTWQARQSREKALVPPPLARGYDTINIANKAIRGEENSNRDLILAIPFLNMYHAGDITRNFILD